MIELEIRSSCVAFSCLLTISIKQNGFHVKTSNYTESKLITCLCILEGEVFPSLFVIGLPSVTF